jgi:hypothetical protein
MDEFNKNNDEKLLEAYKMAQSMDESFQQDYSDEEVDRMLDTISQIESSGGKNFNHPEMKSGIHAGTSAIGSYGLMPNTIQEIANRERMAGNLPPEMEEVSKLPPDQMKQTLETNPDLEKAFARSLASKVLKKQPNEEMAAYSWFQGHNKSPEQIKQENYQDHDYVKKYQEFRKKLFGY